MKKLALIFALFITLNLIGIKAYSQGPVEFYIKALLELETKNKFIIDNDTFNSTTQVNINDTTIATKDWANSLINGNISEFTDPSTNEATSTAVIDTSGIVIITLTTEGNDQTIQSPTDTNAGKKIIIINSSNSVACLNVNNSPIKAGEYLEFVWDGSSWTKDDVPSSFTLNIGATGLRTGGVISGLGLTTFSISAGTGEFVDNTTDPDNPDKKCIAWPAINNVTITNLATADKTYIGLIKSGESVAVVQQTTHFTPSQTRYIIVLGNVAHITNTITNTLYYCIRQCSSYY